MMNYQEQSPLYGMILFRRKKVLIKYIPQGTSRLLQARTAVHFQDVCDVLSPHDAVLDITVPEGLNDTALAAMFPLHVGQSTSTNQLNEITEDSEETSPATPTTPVVHVPVKIGRKAALERVLAQRSGITMHKDDDSGSDRKASYELTMEDSKISLVEPIKSRDDDQKSSSIDSESYVESVMSNVQHADDRQDQRSPMPTPPEKPAHKTKSTSNLVDDEEFYSFRPKVKLAPRPVRLPQNGMTSSTNLSRATASLPAGISVSNRYSQLPLPPLPPPKENVVLPSKPVDSPMMPDVHIIPSIQPPRHITQPPTIPPIPQSNVLQDDSDRFTVRPNSISSRRSVQSSKLGKAPLSLEKQRLLKAVEMRKKQMRKSQQVNVNATMQDTEGVYDLQVPKSSISYGNERTDQRTDHKDTTALPNVMESESKSGQNSREPAPISIGSQSGPTEQQQLGSSSDLGDSKKDTIILKVNGVRHESRSDATSTSSGSDTVVTIAPTITDIPLFPEAMLGYNDDDVDDDDDEDEHVKDVKMVQRKVNPENKKTDQAIVSSLWNKSIISSNPISTTRSTSDTIWKDEDVPVSPISPSYNHQSMTSFPSMPSFPNTPIRTSYDHFEKEDMKMNEIVETPMHVPIPECTPPAPPIVHGVGDHTEQETQEPPSALTVFFDACSISTIDQIQPIAEDQVSAVIDNKDNWFSDASTDDQAGDIKRVESTPTKNKNKTRRSRGESVLAINPTSRGSPTHKHTSTNRHSDESFLLDDAEFDDNDNATIHQATSMSVLRKPATPVLATSRYSTVSSTTSLDLATPNTVKTVIDTRRASPLAAVNTTSNATPPFMDLASKFSTYQTPKLQTTNDLINTSRKDRIGSSISERIARLAQSRTSGSPTSNYVVPNTGRKTPSPTETRKGLFNKNLQSVSPSISIPRIEIPTYYSGQPKDFSKDISPISPSPLSGSSSPRLTRKASVQSKMSVENSTPTSARPSIESSRFKRFSLALYKSHESKADIPTSIQEASTLSSSPTREIPEPDSPTKTIGGSTRASRFLKRMSGISTSMSRKKSHTNGRLAAPGSNSAMSTSPVSPMTPDSMFSEPESTYSTTSNTTSSLEPSLEPSMIATDTISSSSNIDFHSSVPAMLIGDINVQFPSTNLWKRRYVEIDSKGNLVFSVNEKPSSSSSSSTNSISNLSRQDSSLPKNSIYNPMTSPLSSNSHGKKSFDLKSVSRVESPHGDDAELPFSVVLKFRNDTAGDLIIACEDPNGQRELYAGKVYQLSYSLLCIVILMIE